MLFSVLDQICVDFWVEMAIVHYLFWKEWSNQTLRHKVDHVRDGQAG